MEHHDEPQRYPSPPTTTTTVANMIAARVANRATTSMVARRAFHTTRPRMSSPYHYPEGAYTNLPFNPHKKTFPLMFWGYVATGFFLPFGIAVYQTNKTQ